MQSEFAILLLDDESGSGETILAARTEAGWKTVENDLHRAVVASSSVKARKVTSHMTTTFQQCNNEALQGRKTSSINLYHDMTPPHRPAKRRDIGMI